MATIKPARAKAKAAPKKTTSKAVPADSPAVAPQEPTPPTPDDKAEQELILASNSLTSLPVNDTGAEFAPGISLMPALKIITSLAPYKKQVAKLQAAAERAVIDSPEQYKKGLIFLQTAKDSADQLETYRKSVKGPIDDYGRFIQSLFLPLITGLRLDTNKTGAYHVVANKMLAFNREEERKAQEKAADDRKAQQEAAEKLAEEERKKGNVEVAEAIQEAAAAAPTPAVQTSVSHMSVGGFRAAPRKTWKGEVENAFDVLKAILAGNVSLSVLEFKPVELNRYAAEKKVAGVSNGIKCSEVDSLTTKG